MPERMPEADAYEIAIHIFVIWTTLEAREEDGWGSDVVDLLSIRSGVRSDAACVLGSPRRVGRSPVPGRGISSTVGESHGESMGRRASMMCVCPTHVR